MAKIDEKYHKLLQHIIDNGFKYEDPNRKGIHRIQIPSYQIKHYFKDGFPAITTKKLYWKGIVGELLWFLRGDTNIKYLVDNSINIWNKDAFKYYQKSFGKDKFLSYEEWLKITKSNPKTTQYSDLGRIYGAQWRDWGTNKIPGLNTEGEDQISNLIKGLKKNPMGTRHIVTAWNPAELDDMALPPCHWSFEVLVEPLNIGKRLQILKSLPYDKTLEGIPGESWLPVLDKANIPKYQFTLKWHQRSVDTFLGLPFNIASYALLAQIIGKMTNMIPKGIIGDLSNVHIYEPHLDAVKEQLSRDINKYNKCELDEFSGFKMDMRKDIDQWLNSKEISDFKLNNYNSYQTIPAEMLAYNK